MGERSGVLHTQAGGLCAGAGPPRLPGDPRRWEEATGTRRQACPVLLLLRVLCILCPQSVPSNGPGLVHGMTMK